MLQVKGDTYRIVVNGKDVTDVGKLEKGGAATGPIALVGENAVQFRNVFIRELK